MNFVHGSPIANGCRPEMYNCQKPPLRKATNERPRLIKNLVFAISPHLRLFVVFAQYKGTERQFRISSLHETTERIIFRIYENVGTREIPIRYTYLYTCVLHLDERKAY